MLRALLGSVVLAAVLSAPTTAQVNYVTFADLGTTGCGPTLAGTWESISVGNGIRINLTVTTEQEAPAVVLFLSAAPILPGLPIDYIFGQNYNCLLHIDPVFTQAHQALNYSYTWSKSLGAWWGSAYVQFVEVYFGPPLEVKLTNVLEVTRPRV